MSSSELESEDVFSAEESEDVVVSHSKKKTPPLDDAGNPVEYTPHQGEGRQYMRDVILGVNDGLVSMFLLILGVAGGQMAPKQILLTGVIGAVGGAISMALGEYIATKSQAEVIKGDLALETEHFKYHRQQEIDQVKETFATFNIKGDLLDRATAAVGKSDKALMHFMKHVEFGAGDDDERTPVGALLRSGCYFIAGSLPSVLPWIVVVAADMDDDNEARRAGIIASCICCAIATFSVGAIKTRATRGNPCYSGMENFIVAALGSALSFFIGWLYKNYLVEGDYDIGA